MIKAKTIYEFFEGHTKEEVDKAIKELPVENQQLIAIRYGEDLANPTISSLDPKLKVKLYTTVFNRIDRILNGRINGKVKKHSIYEFFQNNTKEEIDAAIEKLPDKDVKLLTDKYGEDLSSPSLNKLSKRDNEKFYGTVLPKLSRILAGKKTKNRVSKNVSSQDRNIHGAQILEVSEANVSVPDVKTKPLTKDEIPVLSKTDNSDVLDFLKKPTFIQMVEKLGNVKSAVILALRLGYVDEKYFSRNAIAEFLNIELDEVKQIEEESLLLYKDSMNEFFDKVIDTVSGSRKRIDKNDL